MLLEKHHHQFKSKRKKQRKLRFLSHEKSIRNFSVTKQEPKSILTSEKTYSKEHWLKRSSSPECESDFVHLDLDQYIEQSTEKMRRLHLEYLQAIEKINTPTTSDDSVQTLKSIYPQMFERLNEDLTPKSQTLEKK